jgi:hypothetical protein
MMIFYAGLDGIKKLFHGVVEDTEICSSSDDIFLNDLYFLVKLLSTFMEIIDKMLILIIF